MNYNTYRMHSAHAGLIEFFNQSDYWPSATSSRSANATNIYSPCQFQGQTDWHAYEPQSVGACTRVKQISQVRGVIGIDQYSSWQSVRKDPLASFSVNTLEVSIHSICHS